MDPKVKILMLKGEKGDPGGSTWGNISGTLSDQTDLETALSEKANTVDLGPVCFSNDYDDLNDKPNLAAVATSGSYNDLTNRPNLATVATSGSYTDLTNRPTQLTDFSGVLPINQGGTNATDVVSSRTNLEVYKEYVLYNNSSGTTETINLSDSVTNYVKLGIYFKSLNPSSSDLASNVYSYQEVYVSSTNDFYCILSTTRTNSSSYVNFCSARAKLELSSIVLSQNQSYYIEVGGSNSGVDSYKIYVTRVVGYKY